MPTLTSVPISKSIRKKIEREWSKSPFEIPIEELKNHIELAEAEIGKWESCLKMLKEVLKSRI